MTKTLREKRVPILEDKAILSYQVPRRSGPPAPPRHRLIRSEWALAVHAWLPDVLIYTIPYMWMLEESSISVSRDGDLREKLQSHSRLDAVAALPPADTVPLADCRQQRRAIRRIFEAAVFGVNFPDSDGSPVMAPGRSWAAEGRSGDMRESSGGLMGETISYGFAG